MPASSLPSLFIHLGRTKTSSAESGESVYLTGRSVDALNAWLAAAKIETGSVFRAIDRWGNVSLRVRDPKAVDDIVKLRAELAGLDPREFSAHGLRSGSLTEAANPRTKPGFDVVAKIHARTSTPERTHGTQLDVIHCHPAHIRGFK